MAPHLCAIWAATLLLAISAPARTLDTVSDNSKIRISQEQASSSSCRIKECQNGGTCNEQGFCDCEAFTEGEKCQNVNCRRQVPKCEESGGQCKLRESNRIPYCDCRSSKVFHMDTEQCEDKCKEDSCLNGGWCNSHGFCVCRRYTSGVKCEFFECKHLIPNCESFGGNCMYNVTTQYPYCQCPPSKVLHKELKRCEDHCTNTPCLNGGSCNADGMCDCLKYTSGARCERVYCKSIFKNCETSGGKCVYSLETKYPVCECPSPRVLNETYNQCESEAL